MTEQVQIGYPKVTYNVAFLRHFIFVPSAGQQGTRYDVCFQGVDGNSMASAIKCFNINGLCPPFAVLCAPSYHAVPVQRVAASGYRRYWYVCVALPPLVARP